MLVAESDNGLAVGARLATVPDERDPNSTHQTLGRGFQTFSVALDRVWVRWEPSVSLPVTVLAGKFGHVHPGTGVRRAGLG